MFITNFFLGLFIVAIGAAGVKYNMKLVNAFGRNNVFERKLGPGMTYPVFQFFAILIILFGFFTMISLNDEIIGFLFSPLTNLFSR